MKKLNVAILVSFLIVTLSSVGIASAQTTTISGTAQVFFDKTPSPGAFVTLTINFQSSTNSVLQLYRIGIHADWQDANQYYTLTFDDLEQVEANGLFSKSVSITIPTNAEIRTHTLTVAIDGYTTDGSTFSWDSTPQDFPVAATSQTNGPTATQNAGANSDLNNTILYAAVIAVVVVVVILIIVVLMKRRSKPAAAPVANEPRPVSSPPPQSDQPAPEDSGSEEQSEGKEFNI